MARIRGTDGNDTLPDTEGDDHILPGKGDDTISLGPGRDSVEIEPYGGNDLIEGFTSGEDTLLVNYFPTIDSVDDLTPFLEYNVEGGAASLNLKAAAGEASGSPNIIIYTLTGVTPQDLGVNTGELYDPDFVPIPPPPEPDRTDGIVIGTDGDDYISHDTEPVTYTTVSGSKHYGSGDPITDGNDTIYTKGGIDVVNTGAGHDTILITPVSDIISLTDFDPSHDTLVFNEFPTFDSFDDLKYPFINSWTTEGRNITVLHPGSNPDRPDEYTNPIVWLPDGMTRDELTPDNIKFNVALDLDPVRVTPVDPLGKRPPRPSTEFTYDPENLNQQQGSLSGMNDEFDIMGIPTDDWETDF